MQTVAYMLLEDINQAILLYIGRDNGFMVEWEVRINGNTIILINNGQSTFDIPDNYIGKFNQRIKELTVLKRQIETGIEPDRDYQIVLKYNKGELSDDFQKDSVKYKSDWHCQYCSWKSSCWSDVLKEILNHKFYIGGQYLE
jgi:hypothetical protein